jgi:hypothetical protein
MQAFIIGARWLVGPGDSMYCAGQNLSVVRRLGDMSEVRVWAST